MSGLNGRRKAGVFEPPRLTSIAKTSFWQPMGIPITFGQAYASRSYHYELCNRYGTDGSQFGQHGTPGRHAVSETAGVIVYYRVDEAGRFIIGGHGNWLNSSGARRQ